VRIFAKKLLLQKPCGFLNIPVNGAADVLRGFIEKYWHCCYIPCRLMNS